MRYIVYCHTSPSGKRYVGWTAQGVQARWKEHVKAARGGSDCPLHRAIRKHGASAFMSQILERMSTASGVLRAERLWIEKLGTFGAGGYNATRGGDGVLGFVPSAAGRARMSAARRARPPASAETRAKMSAAHTGKTFSQESRARMSAAGAARAKGRKLSPETRAKIAAGNRGKQVAPETRAKLSAAAKAQHARKRASGAL